MDEPKISENNKNKEAQPKLSGSFLKRIWKSHKKPRFNECRF